MCMVFNLSTVSKIEFIPFNDYIIAIPLNKSVKNLKSILSKSDTSLSCEEMNNLIKENYDRD